MTPNASAEGSETTQMRNYGTFGRAGGVGGEIVPMLEGLVGCALSPVDSGRMSRPQKAISIKISRAEAIGRGGAIAPKACDFRCHRCRESTKGRFV